VIRGRVIRILRVADPVARLVRHQDPIHGASSVWLPGIGSGPKMREFSIELLTSDPWPRSLWPHSMSRTSDQPAAVLISGGIDSAILCIELLRDFSRVIPLYIRSGLRWEEAELSSLKRFLDAARVAGIESLVVLDEPIADVYGQHWSTNGSNIPDGDTADEAVYLPGRNLLLTVKAAIWCRLREIETLALGSLGSNPFPDCTPAFFQSLETLLNQAMDGKLRLIRPFDRLHKIDVLERGKFLPLHLTFSCINPVDGRHCGICNKCAERRKGFRDAGLADLTSYNDELVHAQRSSQTVNR
jgi:7-cyano-7-deazaguanine synthase